MNVKLVYGVSFLFLLILTLSFTSAACSFCGSRPIQVCTVSDLNAVRNNLNVSYVQTCNIDLAGVSFPPIGTLQVAFRGTYDGNGYSIFNFSYHNDTGISVGLFAANNGTLKNVRLVNVNVSGEFTVGALAGANPGIINNSKIISGVVYGEGNDINHIGGLVGWNGNYNQLYDYTGVIENSYSVATVGNMQGVYTGGLAGINEYGATIRNSSSSGTVYGLGAVGGLVGASVGIIDRSYASGNVFGENSEANGCTNFSASNNCLQAGGLIGLNSLNGIVNRSYATGNVSGYDQVGGAFGKLFGVSTIENVYATGSVYGREGLGGLSGAYSSGQTSPGHYVAPVLRYAYATGNVGGWGDPFYMGGLVGWDIHNDGNVTSSYWDIQTTGQNTSFLGTGKTTSEMYNQSTYTGWNFASIWSINNGVDYPKLR